MAKAPMSVLPPSSVITGHIDEIHQQNPTVLSRPTSNTYSSHLRDSAARPHCESIASTLISLGDRWLVSYSFEVCSKQQ